MLKGYGETVIGLGVTCGPAIGGGLFKVTKTEGLEILRHLETYFG